MIPVDIAERLHFLLESKDYVGLTQEERHWVSQWLTEEEYNRYYHMPSLLKASLHHDRKHISPTANVKKALFDRLETNRKVTLSKSLLFHPIPVYQAAACLVLVFLALFFLGDRKVITHTISEHAVRDTVYQVVERVKEIAKHDTIVRVVNMASGTTKTSDNIKLKGDSTSIRAENTSFNFNQVLAVAPPFDSNQVGTATLKEDSNLMQFSVRSF